MALDDALNPTTSTSTTSVLLEMTTAATLVLEVIYQSEKPKEAQ